jgi:hypothetical protein
VSSSPVHEYVLQGASIAACAGIALNGNANAKINAAKSLKNFNANSLLRAIHKVYPKRE